LHLTVRERERERERDAYFSPAVAPDISGEDEELLQIAQSFSLWTPQEEEDPGLPGAATRFSQTTARNGSSRNESSLFRNEKRETKTETDVPRERGRCALLGERCASLSFVASSHGRGLHGFL
jgi:hypothetical protein